MELEDASRASLLEQSEREAAIRQHAQMMASIKPADDCRHCGEELQEHRRPWACCIECATKIEQRARGFGAGR